jgi:hypothetical protein
MVGPDGTFDRRPSIESAPASIPPTTLVAFAEALGEPTLNSASRRS